MKAATQHSYGLEHITFSDAQVPEPGEGQIRVAVTVASINPADWHLATATPAFLRLTEGLRRPKHRVIGRDAAGVVDAIGPGVTDVTVGQRVFGSMTGAFAEYAIAEANRYAVIPDSVSDETAAGLPIAGVTALQALEKGEVEGRSVVINGASGGVGHYAVQLAGIMGASRVTGVCSGRNVELVAGLGADEVVDYTTGDFTDQQHDVIIECAGSRTASELMRGLNGGGRLVMVGPDKGGPVIGPLPSLAVTAGRFALSSHKFIVFTAEETSQRLNRLMGHAKSGSLVTHIDQEYPLADIDEAFAHLAARRARGKVLIRP